MILYYQNIDFNNYDIDSDKDILINVNARLLMYIAEEKLLNLFKAIIIGYLKNSKGKVYLFLHDYTIDKSITESLYLKFENNTNIIFIKEQLNCVEVENLMGRFNVGLFTRWHAYVHSIRANLPSVIIGWSEKYKETAKIFNMAKRVFDIKNKITPNKVIESLIWVKDNRNKELLKIHTKHEEIKETYILERKGE